MNKTLNEDEIVLKKIKEAKKCINTRLNQLREDPNVKRYIELTRDLIKIDKEYESLMYKYIDDSCDNLLNINV
jgi:hypothetical protein